jgi:glycosyltransferase involved in cell wall biosynthesis
LISVIIPTRNPHPGRLAQALEGLATQTLPSSDWEVVLVDNGSDTPQTDTALAGLPVETRVIREPSIGLTPARLAGINAAHGDVLVFVDDDNILDRSYLTAVADSFAARPSLGAAGGPVVPLWEAPPPKWTQEFHSLLALRDLGPEVRIALAGGKAHWPEFAPVGAGLAVRRSHAAAYAVAVQRDPRRRRLDRNGGSLASGGDNDLVFTCLRAGGQVAYLPELKLTHLIPSGRLECAYLCRLNRAIQRSWVSVLNIHGIRPWPGIPRWSLPIRALRARIRTRYWRGPAHKVRSEGLVGRLEGQADLLG